MGVLRQGAIAVLGAGATLTAGGLLFTQPAPSTRAAPVAPVISQQQQQQQAISEPMAPQGSETSALQSLLGGLALGLVVAFAGVGLPGQASAAAAAKGVPDDFDYRKTPDVKMARQWAKERAAKWANRQFTPPQDKKYSETSTGAGRYKLYGLDFFSPIKSIPDTTNGTYPVRKPAPKKDDRMIKAAEPFLNKPGKYGNFYSPSSPYPYNPK
eukprot:CAMPEP_0197880540 /NCGR_PEP_ID=MMETSP1439-20131203/8311_1 /TAXON_ID=66791 /ORGANISM="Gonyaulax spinifera, Strain CCMP409" /LENGTH=211 /DNA_ID=CAMNT_0043500097 /DNA_START=54 /DNA_END=689 /DNA_ORIENTATION=-